MCSKQTIPPKDNKRRFDRGNLFFFQMGGAGYLDNARRLVTSRNWKRNGGHREWQMPVIVFHPGVEAIRGNFPDELIRDKSIHCFRLETQSFVSRESLQIFCRKKKNNFLSVLREGMAKRRAARDHPQWCGRWAAHFHLRIGFFFIFVGGGGSGRKKRRREKIHRLHLCGFLMLLHPSFSHSKHTRTHTEPPLFSPLSFF